MQRPARPHRRLPSLAAFRTLHPPASLFRPRWSSRIGRREGLEGRIADRGIESERLLLLPDHPPNLHSSSLLVAAMNSLAGYGSGSDSEGEETPAAGGSSSASVAAAAGKRRRASTPGSSSSDGEGNAAPTDAFGLENGNRTATPSSSVAPSSTMTIRAAPQVVLDVSIAAQRIHPASTSY